MKIKNLALLVFAAAAVGCSAAVFPFGFWKSAPTGGGGGGPAFIGVAGKFDGSHNLGATPTTYTLTAAITTGDRIVGTIVHAEASHIVSISDTAGNSYAIDASGNPGSGFSADIFSAQASTGLSSGDTITITWSLDFGGDIGWVGLIVSDLRGVTSVDATGGNNAQFTASPSITLTATASGVGIANLATQYQPAANTGYDGTFIDTVYASSGQLWAVYKIGSSGSQTFGATFAGPSNTGNSAVWYK